MSPNLQDNLYKPQPDDPSELKDSWQDEGFHSNEESQNTNEHLSDLKINNQSKSNNLFGSVGEFFAQVKKSLFDGPT